MSAKQARPGGRSARVRSAVVTAAQEVLVDAGPAEFAVGEVARRAGVHETSIYRRWGTRERLLLEAMATLSSKLLPIPDTGSLREDLIAFGHALAEYAAGPPGQTLLRTMASTSDNDQTTGVREEFWRTRYRECRPIVDRAAVRGEIAETVDARVLLETFVSGVHFRLLLTREEVDQAFLERLADIAMWAAGSAAP